MSYPSFTDSDLDSLNDIGDPNAPVVVSLLSSSFYHIFEVETKLSEEKNYAIKIYPMIDSKPNPDYSRSIEATKIQSPFLIRMLETKETARTIREEDQESSFVSYIIMELAPFGNLEALIGSNKMPRDDKFIRTMFHYIYEGIYALNQKGYAHCDIKASTILIGEDYLPKITGFDYMEVNQRGKSYFIPGTKNFRAPETKKGVVKDLAALDVYSLGIMLILLQSNELPYIEETLLDGNDLEKMLQANDPNFWKVHTLIKTPKNLESAYKELVFGMTKKNPNDRLNMRHIQANSWYMGATYGKREFQSILQEVFLTKGK